MPVDVRIGRDDMNLLSPHTLLAVWCAGFTGIHALHVSPSPSAAYGKQFTTAPPQKLRGTYGGTIRYIQIFLRYGLFASSTCI